jgi:hypothetical protein
LGCRFRNAALEAATRIAICASRYRCGPPAASAAD